MTHHKTNIEACELLEQIEDQAGALWGNCQMYTANPVSGKMLKDLTLMLEHLIAFNEKMER